MLEYFKNLWKRFIEFLQNKFFSTDKYDNIIQDLYNEDILDNDDIDVIQNNKSKNEEIESSELMIFFFIHFWFSYSLLR